MHHPLRSELFTALTLALLSCLLHAALPRELGHDVFAVLLGALGGVYLGGALKGGDRFDIAVTALGAVMCIAIGVAGLRGPWWIVGVGFLLHAVWDWVHHAMRKRTVGRLVAALLRIYDLAVGGYLLVMGPASSR